MVGGFWRNISVYFQWIKRVSHLLLRLAALVIMGACFAPSSWAVTVTTAPVDIGHFGVSPAGAVTYSIPIRTVPNAGGIIPNLSLEYSSENDVQFFALSVGSGWRLSGLPVITRCKRTPAQDCIDGSVNYDYNDRFCIDKKRLVAISGSYGADGTVYHMESDEYSKIISYGTVGSGPQYFKIWKHDGTIIELGKTGG